eukprot:6206570-Pleurochrysis_carterae.AAC.2
MCDFRLSASSLRWRRDFGILRYLACVCADEISLPRTTMCSNSASPAQPRTHHHLPPAPLHMYSSHFNSILSSIHFRNVLVTSVRSLSQRVGRMRATCTVRTRARRRPPVAAARCAHRE